MANSQPMLLYADAIEHLVYNMQAGNNEKEVRDVRMAIQTAYREVAYETDWKYYWTIGQIILNASYSTGTIEYDHTGGSSERLVTLTTGTWPTWARFGRIKIANVVYPIAARLSNSTIQLDEDVNPGTDIASGTSYTLFQNQYALPSDFRRLGDVIHENNSQVTGAMDQTEWLRLERNGPTSGTASRWSLIADPDLGGQMMLAIDPYPTAAATLQFIYQRSPRPVRLTGFESSSTVGTVSASAAGTTVTGTNTTFTSDMVGSFIRIGTSSDAPDGLGGAKPYVEQRKIVSRASATSIEVYPAFTYAASGAKYRVSDPIDISQTMQTAFLRCVEREMSLARKTSAAGIERYEALARQALNMARERDVAVIGDRVAERNRERQIGNDLVGDVDLDS